MCSRRFGRRGVGIRKKASLYTLRYTFGAHKADQHMRLATLQELMGHKKWARRRTSDNGGFLKLILQTLSPAPRPKHYRLSLLCFILHPYQW